MTLIKTSLLNGMAVAVRMLTLLGINKVLAIYVGPAGYAVIGQLQNAVQIIVNFSSGAITTGVTKYTAEYHEDNERQCTVWRTAGSIALLGSIFCGIIVAIFSKSFAVIFLKNENYDVVFLCFSVSLVLFVLNNLLLAILNGKSAIYCYVSANVIGSLLAFLVTAFLSIAYGLQGALIALVVYQSLTFFVTAGILHKIKWFKFSYLFGAIDKGVAVNLAKYTAMALTSAACTPASHLLVRNHLAEFLGWSTAGYWEAMWRFSSAYLMLVTTTLSVYYLPKLAALKNYSCVRKEIIYGYKFIFPFSIALGIAIYISREAIINLLFEPSFLPMRELFAWQLFGDSLKIGSWLLAYVVLAKAMVKPFIMAEIMCSVLFAALAIWLTKEMGYKGVAVAHTITYGCYWMVLAAALRKIWQEN